MGSNGTEWTKNENGLAWVKSEWARRVKSVRNHKKTNKNKTQQDRKMSETSKVARVCTIAHFSRSSDSSSSVLVLSAVFRCFSAVFWCFQQYYGAFGSFKCVQATSCANLTKQQLVPLKQCRALRVLVPHFVASFLRSVGYRSRPSPIAVFHYLWFITFHSFSLQ